MKKVELSPCPFCGDGNNLTMVALDHPIRAEGSTYHVVCACGAEGPTSGYIYGAVDRWNKRAGK